MLYWQVLSFPYHQKSRASSLPAPCKQDALDYEIAATPCEVCLIRHVFGHKVRVLVTSLLDFDAYPASEFGALYHSRWRIEEAFKRIKHRLALEQLSGALV